MTGIDSLYFIDLVDAPKKKVKKRIAALRRDAALDRHALSAINGNGSLDVGQEMNLGRGSEFTKRRSSLKLPIHLFFAEPSNIRLSQN
ncbi:hypothetical protein [Pseudomonas sp. NMS19W]|uniref:hypothetical protein n=1 Tax=Pseudomonas sp. NMS19W TaxID=3079768 RepID=UPI003F654E59